MHISTGARNAHLNAGFGVAFDGGTGQLIYRTGSRPASPNDAPVGTIVTTIPCPSDVFAAAVSGAISINSAPWTDTSADNTGVPTWARLQLSTDLGTTNTTDIRADFDVSTVAAGTGDLQLDNTNIASGQQVQQSSLTITQPA